MSSFGSQWRIIRHFLSVTNLNVEVEKIVQKLKPTAPDQWENFVRKLERVLTSDVTDKVLDKPKVAVTQKKDAKAEATKTDVKMKTPDKITVVVDKPSALDKEPLEADEMIEKHAPELVTEHKELSIHSVLQGLKLKKDISLGKISEPQSWRSKRGHSKVSLQSRTAFVVQALQTAESPPSLLKRTENLIKHLLQNPEAKDYAFKEGALRTLLKVEDRKGADMCEVKAAAQEALAILGWSGGIKHRGPNILSIDGGGIRGLIVLDLLRHLETLTGTKVTDLFDHIVGVSTGAIIAGVLCSGVGNLDTANDLYLNISKKMFGNTSLIGGTSRLVWSHSYYDTEAWERLLQDNLGDITLTQCNRLNTPKMSVISCVMSRGRGLSPFVWRTYGAGRGVVPPTPGDSAGRVWQAVRASAAAPTYFTDFYYNQHLHQDGGIMVNNPTGIGVQEARMLFGADEMKRATIISMGTGRPPVPPNPEPTTPGWRDKFHKILDSATDTEGVHQVLNELLPPGQYYRFNPPLNEPCNMDEIQPDKLNRLRQDTAAYIRRNQYKFELAALKLTRKRTLTQRVEDYVKRKAIIAGLIAS